MTTWGDFAAAAPELAAFGEQRFAQHVAYLATVRADGAPRVHPVTPIIGAGHLFLCMEPTSPKGQDLRRDGRYALHCAVEDADTRTIAAQVASYTPKDRYILFELSVERAASTVYENSKAVRRQWKANTAFKRLNVETFFSSGDPMVRKIKQPGPPQRGGMPGGGGMNQNAMLGQLQQLQQQMMEAQEALGNETVEATSGGGAVTVVMTGHQIVQSIKINPEVVNAEDVELLQDMIVAAVNEAVDKSRKLAEEKMGPLAGGLKGIF